MAEIWLRNDGESSPAPVDDFNPFPTKVGDGANVAQGSTNDVAWNGTAASASLVALLKALWAKLGTTLSVSLVTLLAGEDQVANRLLVEQRNNATYISTAATTTAKTGPGLLHAITVEGGTAGTIIAYDNTAGSGTILASFDSTNALASYALDVQFATGLTIVTGAATKLTVSWR